jgi:hypothetical protein
MTVFSHESFAIAVTAVTCLRDTWTSRERVEMNFLLSL